MTPTTYQKPEIRDANDNIIQQGAFGKNTALANATNDGWIDYVANDLEFLYDLAKDEIVPVASLPASGDMNKTYLLTTNGKTYRWSGTEWIELTNSEAVGRAETAANLAEQWATKTDGTVADNEYSAKYYANSAQQSADDAQDTAEDIADHLAQIDQNTGGVSANSKRIGNIEKLLQGNLYDYDTDDDSAYTKTVPSGAMPYAGLEKVGGKTVVMNQYVPAVNADNWAVVNNGKVSLAFADGECTMTATASGSGYYNYCALVKSAWRNKSLISGHKYYMSFEVLSDYKCSMLSNTGNPYIYVASAQVSATWQRISDIKTASGNYNGLEFDILLASTVDTTTFNVGDVVAKFRKVMFVDLTSMFGAGNEPSTAEEVEAMFPADYYENDAGSLLSAGVTEVVSKDSNNATLQTYSIPASIQSLEGYGWSAGSVYNYIDYERKVFVKNVGRKDLNAANWQYYSPFFFIGYGNFSEPPKKGVNGERANVIMPKYTLISTRTQAPSDLTYYLAADGGFVLQDASYSGDVAAFKASLAGMYLYYELAAPVETDISQYLTDDNLIEVEPAGTITFPNQNGSDYCIPVPSDVTYMIDLQEAINNG